MTEIVANSADDLYLRSLTHLTRRGERLRGVADKSSPGFDQTTYEVFPSYPTTLQLNVPRDRIVTARKTSIFNYVGQWAWFLQGTDSLDDIGFYNPLGASFQDGSSGVLYGPWGFRARSLLPILAKLLRSDPTTRRAVLPIFRPEDVGHPSRNLPCLTSLVFRTREGRLDCTAYMRSTNVYGVLPYDLFLLTMLHEHMSLLTEIPLGVYRHVSESFHLYTKDLEKVQGTLEAAGVPDRIPMPSMTLLPESYLVDERFIRKGEMTEIFDGHWLQREGNLYWKDLLLVTYARRLQKNDEEKFKGIEVSPMMSFEPLKSMVREVGA